jgi:hypothetical protein
VPVVWVFSISVKANVPTSPRDIPQRGKADRSGVAQAQVAVSPSHGRVSTRHRIRSNVRSIPEGIGLRAGKPRQPSEQRQVAPNGSLGWGLLPKAQG